MRKKLYFTILYAVLCINIAGCGKINNKNDNSSMIGSSDNITPSPAITDTETSKPNENTNQQDTQISKDAVLPDEVIGKLTPKQQYADLSRTVKILGLKEYKSIEGDDYTDKAKKGNRFLVLFLSIENNTASEDYINYNYLSAKVDGKSTEHTFLVNEPKNYPTIFAHIKSNGKIGGFIVWEVPEDWKKLEVKYDGWRNIDGLSLRINLNRTNLSDPLMYDATSYSTETI